MVAPLSIMKGPSREESETCVGLPLEMAPSPNHHSSSHRDGDGAQDSGSPDSSTAPDSTSSTTSPQHRADLEERVQELEEKLATLSLLLQQQKGRSFRSISPPSITPPQSPPRRENGSSYLDLESPAAHPRPPTRSSMDRRRRNLSFRVLHSPDSPRQDKVMAELAESMYLPDSLPELNVLESSLQHETQGVSPIRPIKESSSPSSIASPPGGGLARDEGPLPGTEFPFNDSTEKNQMKTNSKGHDVSSGLSKELKFVPEDATRRTTATANEKGDNVKSKWLDYLNSFQESHYDTDKQMQEFVKIPSAVEALLSFGFWICVDSFLYILTILPIRFVWSSLLLARFLAIRMVQKKVPDGPFRFHRRYARVRKLQRCQSPL